MDLSNRSFFDAAAVLEEEARGGGPLAPSELATRFGLLAPAAVAYPGGSWAPGGEYVRPVTVMNTSARTLHVRHTLPACKLLFMAYPDPLALAPGMSATLEVRFRPVRFEEIDDAITFSTELGSFRLPVRVRLARLAVRAPEEVPFGVVPVNEPTVAPLELVNDGEVEAAFEWRVEPPFLLTPRSGRVAPRSAFAVSVTVMPAASSVLAATATCVVQGGELVLPVRLTALAKYQHIDVAPSTVDFGAVPVGAAAADAVEREVAVRNLGAVRATVTAELLEPAGSRFACVAVRPPALALAPGAAGAFTLRLAPRTAGARVCERVRFSSPGGGALVVTAVAAVVGPTLTIERRDLDGKGTAGATATRGASAGGGGGGGHRRPLSVVFPDARVGESSTQVVTLTNTGREPAAYDLECEDSGVFAFSKTKGVLKGGLSCNLVVRFGPLVPGNFYRRVQCLVAHGDAVYVDVIGTAWDDKTRPAPLKQRHVDAARLRPPPVRLLAPDALLRAVQAGAAATTATASAEAEFGLSGARARSGDRSRAANALLAEYFTPPDAPELPVALLEDTLEFAPTSRGAPVAEAKAVRVVNRSAGKVTVTWVVPPSKATGAGVARGADGTVLVGAPTPPADFVVTPGAADVEPGSSAEFRVTFAPTLDAYYYMQELEAWVAPKINRSFRLVDDASFTPPTCLALKAIGHTFRDAQSFSPAVATSIGGTLQEQSLVLPPCAVGDAVYYTFQVSNAGEVPTLFSFGDDPTGVFTILPAKGMLPVKSFQCVTVRFTPRHVRPYTLVVPLTLNHSPDDVVRITLVGAGDAPRLLLPDGGRVFIKPTALGIASTRAVTLRNVSRLPLRYELRPPPAAAGVVILSATHGDVEGGAEAELLVTFAPSQPGVVSVDIPVLVYSLTGSETNALVLALRRGEAVAELEERLHIDNDSDGAGGGGGGGGAASAGAAAGAGGGRFHVPGEPWQRLVLTVSSEGTFGALSFDTRTLDFGASLVHGRVTAPLYLENRSDCALRYELDAILQVQISSVDLDRDDSGIVEAAEIATEFSRARWYERGASPPHGARRQSAGAPPGAAAAGAGAGAAPAGGAAPVPAAPAAPGVRRRRQSVLGMPEGLFTRTVALSLSDTSARFVSEAPGEAGAVKKCLEFDRPVGVLAARSRVRVEVAFSPPIAATFRARIYYRLRTDGETGEVGVAGAHAVGGPAVPAFTASFDAALAAAKRAEADTRDPAMVDWSAEPKNESTMLCEAVGVGACPTVCVEDARALTSREALLTTFPRHFAGMHNAFMPERVGDKAELMMVLGLEGAGPNTPAHAGAASVGAEPPAAAAGVVGPRPWPHDLWVRPGAWTVAAAAYGSAAPETKGWGGWRFALAEEVDAAAAIGGSGRPAPTRDQLPVPPLPSALSLLGPAGEAMFGPGGSAAGGPPLTTRRAAAAPVPSSAGALWRLWSQFSLRDLNRYLATQLTADEKLFNFATQMTRDPVRLAAFAFEFDPRPLGSPPSVVLLHFRNTGLLPAVVNITLPHERDVDVEGWVEVDETSADELQDNELLERRVFGISPRALRLLPGQAATVRFHYAYASLVNAGAHEIVVLLRVRNGKPVRLFLRGRTLPAATPYLYSGLPSRTFRLAAVPLGVAPVDAPLQYIPLYNTSGVPLRWRVSSATVRALAAVNYGVEVVRLVTKEGVIPAGGEDTLVVAFTPLEERIYKLRLDIAYVSVATRRETRFFDIDDIADGKESVEGGVPAPPTAAEDAAEESALNRLLRIAARLGRGEPADGPATTDEDDAHAGLDGVMESVRSTPDVGIGLETGQAGYEADYPGVLQIFVEGTGYRSVNDRPGTVAAAGGSSVAQLPLVTLPTTIGLGLKPPHPPVGVDATPAMFESSLTTEMLPIAGTDAAPPVGRKRRNSVYAPPPAPSASTNTGLFAHARFAATPAHDAIADGVYLMSGLDAVSGAVATGHNPLDALTTLIVAGDEGTTGPGNVAVFSGPDAARAAVAAEQLGRARLVLASLRVDDGAPPDGAPDGSSAPAAAESVALVATSRLPPASGSVSRGDDLFGLLSRMSSPPVLRCLYRPLGAPPLFVGAFPPARPYAFLPHADLPEGLAFFSTSSWVRFGDVPSRAVQHSLVVLRHARRDGGVAAASAVGGAAPALSSAADASGPTRAIAFCFDPRHPLVVSGALRFSPSSGVIAPGGAAIVRVTLSAGAQPRVLSADVACVVSVMPREQRERAAALLRRSLELADALKRRAARGGTGGRSLSPTGHTSVADKTTISRSVKLEASARELAYRAAVRAAGVEAVRGRTVYEGSAAARRAARAAARGAAPPADGAAAALSAARPAPARAPPPPAAARAAGNAVHLLAAAAAAGPPGGGAFSPEASTVDGTSVEPTVGDDRPRLAAVAAGEVHRELTRAAALLAAAGPASVRDGARVVVVPTTAEDAQGMLNVGSGPAGAGGGGADAPLLPMPPPYTRDSADPGRSLMRSVVKDGLRGGSGARGGDAALLRSVSAGAESAAVAGRGGGARPPGAADTTLTAAERAANAVGPRAAPRLALDPDGDTTRRVRIANRTRNRLSPPRAPAGGAGALSLVGDAPDDGDSLAGGESGGAWGEEEEKRADAAGGPAGGAEGGGGGGGGAGGARGRLGAPAQRDVDASRLLLPPPPHAALFLHVSARVCAPGEYLQAYTPAHAAAFFYPARAFTPFAFARAGAAAAAAAGAGGGDGAAEPPAPAAPADAGAAIADVLATLLAEAARAPAAGAGGPGGGGGELAPAPLVVGTAGGVVLAPGAGAGGAAPGDAPAAAGTAGAAGAGADGERALVDGGALTFAALRAAGGDATRVPSRAQRRALAGGAPGGGGADGGPDGGPGVAPGVALFSASVPRARPAMRDADVTSFPAAAAALLVPDARDAVARTLEAALLALARDAVEGTWQPLSESDSAREPPPPPAGRRGLPALDVPGALDEAALDEEERAMLAAIAAAGGGGAGAAGAPSRE